jgi:hypothetical protein
MFVSQWRPGQNVKRVCLFRKCKYNFQFFNGARLSIYKEEMRLRDRKNVLGFEIDFKVLNKTVQP